MTKLLEYFLRKACNQGLDQVATVPEADADIIQLLRQEQGFNENFYVEDPRLNHPSAYVVSNYQIYTLDSWRKSAERIEKQRLYSEQERQISTLKREQLNNLALEKIAAFKEARRLLNLKGKTDKEITYILNLCEAGELEKLSAKLGIAKYCATKSLTGEFD
jgi:hypothetical protein